MSQEDRLTGLVGFSGMKVPVKAATTAAITLSGEQTIDGIACVSDDRVLVKDQASGVNNGIYVVDSGDWERAPDADGPFDFVFGSLVPVASGTTNGSGIFRLTTTGTITPGTSSLAFSAMGLLSAPVPIASGGTGATTVPTAQANLLLGTQSTVASSATPDIWTGTGTQIDLTGSTGPITGFAAAPRAGISRVLVCASTPTLNHGANLLLPGSANYTATAGDVIYVYALTTTQFRLAIFKADGTAVVGRTFPAGIGPLPYAGTVAPTGFLLFGSDFSRTTYADLFAVVGTTYGEGDGVTTFGLRIPGRVVVAAGTGTTVEAVTASSGNGFTVTSNNTKWITGMTVVVSNLTGFGGTVAATTYYAVRVSATNVRLASTLALAQAGSPDITITGTGTATLTTTFTARANGEMGGEEGHAMSSTELLAHVHGGVPQNAANSANGAGTYGGANGNSSSTGGNAAANIMQPFIAVNQIISY